VAESSAKPSRSRGRNVPQTDAFASQSGPINIDFLGFREKNRSVSSLAFLAVVNIVIWAGLFLYVWRLDRRLAERERNR
jgi:CcmD family protein